MLYYGSEFSAVSDENTEQNIIHQPAFFSGNSLKSFIVRIMINGSMCVAAFAVMSYCLASNEQISISTSDEFFRAKLDYFEEHKDEYDVVFFGGSRIYRGFDPHIFDNEMTSQWRYIRSFNFGVGAMRAHEQNHLIRQVLAMKPKRLRWVFVELMDWSPTIVEGGQYRYRDISYHTVDEVVSICRTVYLSEMNDFEKLRDLGIHLNHMLARYCNLGQGSLRIRLLLENKKDYRYAKIQMEQGEGYFPIEHETSKRYEERRRIFLTKNYGIVLKQISQIPEQSAAPANLENINLTGLKQVQKGILEFGAEPIFVVYPYRWGTPHFKLIKKERHLLNVFEFNDPEKFPALYNPDHYWDRGHFKIRGAKEFTSLLSSRFIEWLREK